MKTMWLDRFFTRRPKAGKTKVVFKLTPKEDITTYELALLMAHRGATPKEIYRLPDCCLRHLTEVILDAKTLNEIHERPALKDVTSPYFAP